MILGGLLIILISKKLNIVVKVPFLAKSLGVKIDQIYWISGIASALITVSSVILVVSIAMLWIVIPHLIRKLFKTRNYLVDTPSSGLLWGTIIIKR